MKFDVSIYRVNKFFLGKVIEQNPETNYEILLSRASVSSGCPLIALYYYYGEIFGFTENVRNKLKELMLFYDYDGIIGDSEFDIKEKMEGE
jgi:hypothetical protein